MTYIYFQFDILTFDDIDEGGFEVESPGGGGDEADVHTRRPRRDRPKVQRRQVRSGSKL